MKIKRIIYFGTDGCAGHYPKGINCTLTDEDRDDFNRLDALFDSEKVWAKTRGLFHYTPRPGHSYICYGVPYSPDGPRPGSKTVIALEDGTAEELWDALRSSPFVLGQFKRVEEMYGVHNAFIDYDKRQYTCRLCLHRERWQCGSKVISYCNKLKSNRTDNGMKKVKCTDAACDYYESE